MKSFTADRATETIFRDNAASASLLHLATHAVVDVRNPLYSYVVFSGDGQADSDNDGRLEAWEILRVPMHADLAIFSACDSARGGASTGEGLIGLSWALFASGVHSTVLSQWSIDSAGTSALMMAFHRELKAGGNTADALRTAALKTRRDPKIQTPLLLGCVRQHRALSRGRSLRPTGLVQSSVSVHGATTLFAHHPSVRMVSATTNGHWSKTLLHGLGHTVSTQSGYGSVVVSETDTVYGPCACSPAGKVIRVSQPYGISGGVVTSSDGSGTVAWTQYSYDGLGRTLTSTAPDGSVTQYIYQGNLVKVIDPAGNWKRYTSDALGHLLMVAEPNPQYGQADNGATNFQTTYSYDLYTTMSSQVSMPRPYGGSSYTQTRTYSYDAGTGRLMSQTLPENGTTSFAYYPSGRLASKTDARGSDTLYSYDGYGRLEYVDRYPGSSASGYYDPCQSLQLVWDNTQRNGMGRLQSVNWGSSSCQFGYLSEQYGYSAGGLITFKATQVSTPQQPYYSPQYGYQYPQALGSVGVSYTYDNEGHQTGYALADSQGCHRQCKNPHNAG